MTVTEQQVNARNMQNFTNAPHRGGSMGVPTGSPNAALLIDFDNVTMGIRSDLTRQLKDLLNSDIIKGKVAVQRAYADWRRYAQYIVPLSEASVDLIFAPAYGSSKKNATDIRLAIDATELVFTRPEIGVFILLSGDSDFSSLVLKLKEYGKYVIGVGLRESASDLLVQNCDEYYSYSSLTGLKKAGEEDTVREVDPWELAERAVGRMATDKDVMRSDRLKQVMLELDPSFDESKIGYSKFNKFLTEAASRNRLDLRKLGNGQYEVQPYTDGGVRQEEQPSGRGRGGRGRRDSSRTAAPRAAEPATPAPQPVPSTPQARSEAKPAPRPSTPERRKEELEAGYDLLRRAIRELTSGRDEAARDSDIKRQILEIQPGWDEAELGFTKFSRFLRQAHSAEVIDLTKTAEGYSEARLPGGTAPSREREQDRGQAGQPAQQPRTERRPEPKPEAEAKPEKRVEATPEPKPQPEQKAEAKPEPEPRRPEPKKEPRPEPKTEARQPEAKPEAEPKVETGKPEPEPQPKAETSEPQPSQGGAPAGRGVGMGRRRREGPSGPPPLLPGQVVGGKSGGNGSESGSGAATSAAGETSTPSGAPMPPAEPGPQPKAEGGEGAAAGATPSQRREEAPRAQPAPGAAPAFDADELGLPTEEGAVIRYLSNSYQGVGQKTAEALISAFGADSVFNGLNSQPERVKEILGSGRRTEALLNAWQRDYRRRTTAGHAGSKA